MILAAGLGTRMAPLSTRYPKPALPVLDEPMLAHLVHQLAAQGVEHVVVNTHAFPEQLKACLGDLALPIVFSEEASLLGSAGGIFAARQHLVGSEPFLVLNADMRVDIDLYALRREHMRTGALATLVLRDDARKTHFGSIGFTSGGAMCRITERVRVGDEIGCGLFTGIQMMEPRIFEHFPQGGVSELMPDVYAPLLRSGARLGTLLQDPDREWWPIGTPGELLEINLRVLEETLCDQIHIDPSATVDGRVTGPAWIGARAHVPDSAELGPNVVVGARAELPRGFGASDSLVLADSRPPTCARLERAIAFDREVWRDA